MRLALALDLPEKVSTLAKTPPVTTLRKLTFAVLAAIAKVRRGGSLTDLERAVEATCGIPDQTCPTDESGLAALCADACAMLADELSQAGRTEDAKLNVDRALAISPQHFHGRVVQACMTAETNLGEGKKLLRKVTDDMMRDGKKSVLAWLHLGRVLARAGDDVAAADAWHFALTLNVPTWQSPVSARVMCWAFLALRAAASGRKHEANAIVQRIFQENQDGPVAQWLRGSEEKQRRSKVCVRVDEAEPGFKLIRSLAAAGALADTPSVVEKGESPRRPSPGRAPAAPAARAAACLSPLLPRASSQPALEERRAAAVASPYRSRVPPPLPKVPAFVRKERKEKEEKVEKHFLGDEVVSACLAPENAFLNGEHAFLWTDCEFPISKHIHTYI